MVETAFKLNGITCNGCVAKLTRLFSQFDGVHDVSVDKELGMVVLKGISSVDRYQVEQAISPYPKYSWATKNDAPEDMSMETFKPLIIVIGFILLLVAISQISNGAFNWRESMSLFMGGFFIAFSFFKFLDLKGFAQAYQSYDIIASRWMVWGYIYPFVELLLGILFLFNIAPFYANLLTLIVLGVSSIGVIESVLAKKKIKCACLGTGFNLPMTTVTIIEDVSMVLMSITMLLTL